MRVRSAPAYSVGFVLLLSSPVAAQEPPEGSSAREHPVVAPRSQAPTNDADEPRPGWRFRWDDHPSLRFGRDTRIDFRARFQMDARDSKAPIGDSSTMDFARRRIGVDGRIAGIVDFQVEREIANDDPWKDVYADYRQFTWIRVQAGKFKLPFSLDENTSATNLDFVYRSRAANQLAPGRDRGVMLHGRVAKGVLGYELGWFDHVGRNANTGYPELVVGNRTTAGRLSVQPFRSTKSPLRDVQFAVALTGGDVPEALAALQGRTALDASFFSADVWVKGRRRRTGLEARWQPGPFSIKAEYMRVSTERRKQSVEGTDLSPLIADGWYVSGTWAVTGEEKANGLDQPRRSILRGGPGAIELAARLESLAFRSAASGEPPSIGPRAEVILGSRDRAATLGINWYPYRAIKIQANVIREAISNATPGTLPAQSALWSTVLRFQFTI
jgi:phosphate-selective porin OprO/OprP